MPEIAGPANLSDNSQYKNLQMNRPVNISDGSQKKATDDTGAVLNQLSGVKEKSFFVDRNTHNKMGKDEFLKLLTHQLSNQDPMNPMDQSKFAADLAQFAQLEQLANMNSKMDKKDAAAPMEAKFYAASFLGKEVVTTGTSVDLQGENDMVEIPFSLDKDAAVVNIKVFDARGNMVAMMNEKNFTKGSSSVMWDGRGLDKYPQPKGNYRVAIQAFDESFQKVPAQTKVTGVVNEVTFENGETVLKVNGKKVFLRDVEQFKLPMAQSRVNVGQYTPPPSESMIREKAMPVAMENQGAPSVDQ